MRRRWDYEGLEHLLRMIGVPLSPEVRLFLANIVHAKKFPRPRNRPPKFNKGKYYEGKDVKLAILVLYLEATRPTKRAEAVKNCAEIYRCSPRTVQTALARFPFHNHAEYGKWLAKESPHREWLAELAKKVPY